MKKLLSHQFINLFNPLLLVGVSLPIVWTLNTILSLDDTLFQNMKSSEIYLYFAVLSKSSYALPFAATAYTGLVLMHDFSSRRISSYIYAGFDRRAIFLAKIIPFVVLCILAALSPSLIASFIHLDAFDGLHGYSDLMLILRPIVYEIMLSCSVVGLCTLSAFLFRDLFKSAIIPTFILVLWEQIEESITGGAVVHNFGLTAVYNSILLNTMLAVIFVVTITLAWVVFCKADLR